MFDRILFFVNNSAESLAAADKVISLADKFGSQIIALNIVDPNVARQLTRVGGKRESEIYVELEEDGWKYLYHVEELATEQGVKILLQQDEGTPENLVVANARQFKVDLVTLAGKLERSRGSGNVERMVTQLIKHLDCPVLVL
ncbi:MAG: universal stress protein [bacterium]|jgi:nucleotide-binding universal stress UspA family protein|nr:universal stress protein [bacterium]